MPFLRFVASSRVGLVLLGAVFVTIFVGTLGQSAWGAAAVQTTLYSQFWFVAGGVPVPGLPWWFALLAVQLLVAAALHLPRKLHALGLWLAHAAVVLFCLACVGFTATQEELVLGLPVGSSAQKAFVRSGAADEERALPFTISVTNFSVPTYPGSDEPQDYVSTVRLRAPGLDQTSEIRMNQPLRVGGLTIYQSSVETFEGRQAPVFKLTSNRWGFLPYLLSVLLVLGLVLHAALRGRAEVGRA